MSTRIAFAEQTLPAWKRAVLKVGSSLLADDGGLSPRNAQHLAAFVEACQQQGREVVIVSSGAVAAGRAMLHASPRPGAAMAERQALAALGQAKLMAFWQGFFARPVAQVLLTHDDVRNRRRYLNAQATLRELLRCGALPIVNENDTVSVDELKLGDNDTLGAIVAALIDADVLFIATDIDGLYDRDPRAHVDARPLAAVADPGDDILAMAGGAGSAVGTGGMRTKILAAQRAGAAGIDTVLFNGTRAAVAHALGEGRLTGTRLVAGRSRIAARKHWLRHAPVDTDAAIVIDAGAAAALIDRGASLLPIGVADARGEFRRGDLVEIVLVNSTLVDSTLVDSTLVGSMRVGGGRTPCVARGVTQYSAADIRRIARRQSHEIEGILGYNYGETIVHRDDLCLHASHPNEAADV
ncbi:MAG: glutamate 5-kinase [Lysobacter sp.]|nr:glutamate 5-kinase [Lysobacter sp.]